MPASRYRIDYVGRVVAQATYFFGNHTERLLPDWPIHIVPRKASIPIWILIANKASQLALQLYSGKELLELLMLKFKCDRWVLHAFQHVVRTERA